MNEDRLLLLKNAVEDENNETSVRHATLRVLLKLTEHRNTAEAMISNHMLALYSSMLRPQVRLLWSPHLCPFLYVVICVSNCPHPPASIAHLYTIACSAMPAVDPGRPIHSKFDVCVCVVNGHPFD